MIQDGQCSARIQSGEMNMAKDIEYVSNLNLQGNEIKNAVIENVSELPEGKAGRVVYLTAESGKGYYYYDGTAWKLLTDKTVTDALATRLSVVEAATGTGGSQPGESLADKINALQTTVGDSTSGLVKDVADNKAAIATNKTEISNVKKTAEDAASKAQANETAIGSDTVADSVKGRIKTLEGEMDTAQADIETLQTAVGDSGLKGRVDTIEGIVGTDAAKGLQKAVADNTAAIATKANSADVYTKSQTDAEVKKATDAAATNATAIKALQDAKYLPAATAESTYRKISDSYTKGEVDDKVSAAVSSVYKIKGTIASVSALPSDAAVGDVYNIQSPFSDNGKNYPAGTNVVYVATDGDYGGGKWDILAGVTDLTAYSTTEQMNSAIDTKISEAGHASKSYVDTELAKKVDTTTTVNGHALSANINVTAEDLGLENVDNTADADKPISTATQAALDGKVSKLASKPTAGTYAKVTINGEGQVTAGASLAASDIPSLTASKISDFAAAVKALRFVHTYNVTETSQVVEHNLGIQYPQVMIYKGNAQIFATVEYTDENKITISGNIALGAITVVVSI